MRCFIKIALLFVFVNEATCVAEPETTTKPPFAEQPVNAITEAVQHAVASAHVPAPARVPGEWYSAATTTTSAPLRLRTRSESLCPWYQFKCTNGRCVQKSWICDMEDDCGDRSDEKDCHLHRCSLTYEFRCISGLCVSRRWVCDMIRDCPHGDDENNCHYKRFTETQMS